MAALNKLFICNSELINHRVWVTLHPVGDTATVLPCYDTAAVKTKRLIESDLDVARTKEFQKQI
jgi:hypothetical protein